MHAWSCDSWQLSFIECSHTTAHALPMQCTVCAKVDLPARVCWWEPGILTLISMRTVYAGACKKGCQGPVLRTLQRFGALGRRSNGPKGTLAEPEAVSKRSKDCRCLPAVSCNRCLHVNNFSYTGLRETVHCMRKAFVVSSMNPNKLPGNLLGNLIGNLLGNMCIDTSALWHCIGPHWQ